MPEQTVRAAGGVVLRGGGPQDDPGGMEFAVVHRAKYGDWSLPKGKLEPGESEEAGALREVAEETGLACRLVRRLDTVEYRDRQGRRKVVAYWLMEVAGGELRPDHEIDRVAWVRVAEAPQHLSYPRDAAVVQRAFAPAESSPPAAGGPPD
ncbi:MAG: NUDIX hydrolase [Actinomycetota bacterium]